MQVGHVHTCERRIFTQTRMQLKGEGLMLKKLEWGCCISSFGYPPLWMFGSWRSTTRLRARETRGVCFMHYENANEPQSTPNHGPFKHMRSFKISDQIRSPLTLKILLQSTQTLHSYVQELNVTSWHARKPCIKFNTYKLHTIAKSMRAKRYFIHACSIWRRHLYLSTTKDDNREEETLMFEENI